MLNNKEELRLEACLESLQFKNEEQLSDPNYVVMHLEPETQLWLATRLKEMHISYKELAMHASELAEEVAVLRFENNNFKRENKLSQDNAE